MPSSIKVVRVLVVDDHRIMRDGLKSLLSEDGVQVVAEAGDGRSAVEAAIKIRPDLAIIDVGMPDLNGIEATRQIRTAASGTKVIVLSMHSDQRLVVAAMQAGAAGYVLKDSAFEELRQAVRTVSAGWTYLSPRIAGLVVGYTLSESRRRSAPDDSPLPRREREVLQLIAEGRSTKEVAARLRLSVKTVETYRERLMERVGLHTVADLTRYAVREGIVALETRDP